MESLFNRLGILTSEKHLWILELFFVVLAALAAGHIVNKTIDRLEKHAAKTASVWDDALIEACRRPLVWLIWILGINFAASIAAHQMESVFLPIIDSVNRLTVVILGALFLQNFFHRS